MAPEPRQKRLAEISEDNNSRPIHNIERICTVGLKSPGRHGKCNDMALA